MPQIAAALRFNWAIEFATAFEWLTPFSTADVPYSDCVAWARDLGNSYRRADYRLIREPEQTVEAICTDDVLRRERDYNVELTDAFRFKHVLERTPFLLGPLAERISQNKSLIEHWNSKIRELYSSRENGEVNLRSIIDDLASTSHKMADATIRSASVVKSLPKYLTEKAYEATPLELYSNVLARQAIDMMQAGQGFGSHPQSSQRTIVANLLQSFRETSTPDIQYSGNSLSAVGVDGGTLVYSPGQPFNIKFDNVGLPNFRSTFSASRSRTEERDSVRLNFLNEYSKHDDTFSNVRRKFVVSYHEKVKERFSVWNRIVEQSDATRTAIPKPELLASLRPSTVPALGLKTAKAFVPSCSGGSECSDLRTTVKELASKDPSTNAGQMAQLIGLTAGRYADQALGVGDSSAYEFNKRVLKGMTQICAGILMWPAVPIYEAISGKNIFGEKLTPTERAISILAIGLEAALVVKTLTPLVREIAGISRTVESIAELERAGSVVDSFASNRAIRFGEAEIRAGETTQSLRANPLNGTTYSDRVQKMSRLTDFHGFPREVDNFAGFGTQVPITGGDGISRVKVLLPGWFRGKEGTFEWIVEPNMEISHRLFRPN